VSVAPLSRNTTEVMGAFATFDPQSPKRNSIDFSGLRELQTLVTNLRSPRWQDPRYGLPPVDAASAARGDSLYMVHCQTCHTVHERELDLPDRIEIDLTALDSIRTDSSMAVDFIAHEILSADGDTLGPAEALSSTLKKVWRKGRLFSLLLNAFFDEGRGEKGRITEDLRVYKARPLDGIWATGPFLHNGSVRNVYDIMLPAGQRADRFCVGRRTVEADSLGFDSGLADCANDGFFVLDTSLPGNRNTGHDGVVYGTSGSDALTHRDRMDIIEFIKTE
jgi:hypothetical protein